MAGTLEIALNKSRPFYATDDLIEGTVIFNCKKDIKIKDIVIQFHGICNTSDNGDLLNSTAEVAGPDATRRTERHALQQTSVLLFPDENLVRHSNEKTVFKLVRGRHLYPFKIQISKYPLCIDPAHVMSALSGKCTHMTQVLSPPSCVKLDASEWRGVACYYELTAKVKRLGFMSSDLYARRPINYFPFVLSPRDVVDLNSRRKMALSPGKTIKIHGEEIEVFLGLFTPQTIVLGEMPLSLCLVTNRDLQSMTSDPQLIQDSSIIIKNIKVELLQRIRFRAMHHKRTFITDLPILNDQPNKRVDLSYVVPVPNTLGSEAQFSVDISDFLHGKTIPKGSNITPSFQFCNWSSDYDITAEVDLADPDGTLSNLKLSEEVLVLPPVDVDRERRESAMQRQLDEIFGLGEFREMNNLLDENEELPSYEDTVKPVFSGTRARGSG